MLRLSSVIVAASLAQHRAASLDEANVACGADGTCSASSTGDATSALQLDFGRARSLKSFVQGPEDVESIFEEMVKDPAWSPRPTLNSGRSCHINDPAQDGCLLSSDTFPQKTSVLVYPGGQTACLSGDPYFFQVVRGESDKLHFHLQGGGACWDKLSYQFIIKDLSLCVQSPVESVLQGAFDPYSDQNPLKDHTLVVVQYCSGDVHVGNASHPWGAGGQVVRQAGFYNTDAVLTWALAQFPRLSSLVFSGSSAGSLGVQVWARTVLAKFADRSPDVAVVGDSFLGVVYPPSIVQKTETDLIDIFGLCNTDLITGAQMAMCQEGTLLFGDLWVNAMKLFPEARFSNINSKADAIQILFEKAFELTVEKNLAGVLMTQGQYYKTASLLLQDWQELPNFYSYLVDGNQHTYLPFDYTWLATPFGPNASAGMPHLGKWLQALIEGSGDAAPEKSVCLGPNKTLSKWTVVTRNETTYCSTGLVSA